MDELKNNPPDDGFNLLGAQDSDITKTKNLLLQTNFLPIDEHIAGAKAIYCYGTGHNLLNYMRDFSRNLMNLVRVPVVFLGGISEFEAVLYNLTSDDCVFVASISGRDQQLIEDVKVLQLNEVPIIAFSEFSDNPLASLATANIYYYLTPIPNPVSHHDIVSLLPLGFCIDYLMREYIRYAQNEFR